MPSPIIPTVCAMVILTEARNGGTTNPQGVK
jgi:hypothetical protein